MALDLEFFNNITDFNELSSECQTEIKTDIENGFESGVVVEQVIDDNNNIYWGDVDWQLMADGTIEVTINELEGEEDELEEEEEKGGFYKMVEKAILKNNTLSLCELSKDSCDEHIALKELVDVIDKACNNKLNRFSIVNEHCFTISCNIDKMLFKADIQKGEDGCKILLDIQQNDCPRSLSRKITLGTEEFINYLQKVKASIDLYLQN